MMHTRIPGYALLALLIVATPAFARVVISEVMWMGSDQSTADEWVELAGLGTGGSDPGPWSLSGWTLTSIGSDGTEKSIVRFENVSIDASQYLVVSNYPASQSRLAADPVLTTTAMTLPNTKLFLRLRDASGAVVDEVDDGIGVPFAGVNPSGTGAKASMERIDLIAVGNVKENWQTATAMLGFDPGVPIFGTPGFSRPVASSSPSVSSVSLAPQSSSSASDVGSVASSFTSFSSCNPDVSNIRIAVQSGDTRGEGKVTVNLQARWEGKGNLQCAWDYGDGFTSASCNPPSHTFMVLGRYEVRLETGDSCGGRGVQTLPVEVREAEVARGPWRTGSRSSASTFQRARATRVIDGDTVEVSMEGKIAIIRILGIDAPERGQKWGEVEWGDAAREAVRGLLEGAVVELTFDEERKDVYGRTLAYLAIRGHDIGAELLRQGLAEVYRKCRCVRKEEYFRLEEEARESKVGMWGKGKDEKDAKEGKDWGEEAGMEIPSPLGGSLPAGRQGLGRGGRKVSPSSHIVLSEIYPVPLPAEEEWVELWNGGREPVDLSGWRLDDAEDGGSRAWEFPQGFIVPPNAFLVLRHEQTHLAFNNEGDSLVLLNPDGAIVDHMEYNKLRRGSAFARVIQRLGNTGEFRATDRFCVTDHPTPFERNICRQGHASPIGKQGDARSSVPPKVRRVVRLARRVRYRNMLPAGTSGGVIAIPDPMVASLLAHMERSVQSGQVVWREGDVLGNAKTAEWEAMLLPFLLIVGAHTLLTGMRRGS